MTTAVSGQGPVQERHTVGTLVVRHRLWLLRALWLVAATLALGIVALGTPAYYHQLRTLSAPAMTDPAALRAGLAAIGLSARAHAVLVVSLESLLSLGFVAIAAFLAARKSNDALVLFVSLALILFGTTFPEIDDAVAVSHPGLAWLPALLNLAGFVGLFTCFYVFPDGRFIPRWAWPLPALWVVEEIGHIVEDHWHVLELPNMVLFLGLIGTCVYAQIHRYRKVSGPVQRQQTKWVVFGFTVAVAGFLVYGFSSELVEAGAEAVLHELTVGAVMAAGFLSVPLSICIAILRYRLWDIDVVINRTLVYGTLTAGVVGVYSLVVGYLGLLFQAGDNLAFSVIAAGAVAILFQPARERVQRLVNRLMYGERDEPYAVLARLGQRLEATMAPDAILPTIVETIAQALKLPYVAIDLWHEDRIVAAVAHGTPGSDTTSLPLVYQSVPVGHLRLSPRAPGEPFSQADQRLLAGIAHQAGVAAYAVQLTADLQRSRERLVTMREEERRRIRRDLHDGLGPALGSMSLKLDAARNQLRSDPAASDALLAELKTQVQSAIADIRNLVYDLRPPALDDLGLVAALRQQAERHGAAGTLRVTVDAPENLPPLPAAVEVAAYRIALEALLNVARHARARSCHICLRLDQGLVVEVTDDGQGLPDHARPGVGSHSMRERAQELGGTCLMGRLPQGGTRVVARLPLPVTSEGET